MTDLTNLRIQALAVQQGISKDFLEYYLRVYHHESLTNEQYEKAVKGYNNTL